MIHIDKVTADFGKKSVLNGIDVPLREGEIIGLAAPNDPGKSTLLNVLMNYVTSTSGHVIFNDNLNIVIRKRNRYLFKDDDDDST